MSFDNYVDRYFNVSTITGLKGERGEDDTWEKGNNQKKNGHR